ncbi:MAG: NACHT domain-containing protein, partial [Parachlamydiaceae bacterium]
MGWISQLLDNWRKENCSKDEEKTKGFCDCLSHYVFKQIICLESGKEYPLHVGWPGHSICVVFAREENENLLTIRIDNLGDGCDRHSKNKQGHVQSKILRQYDIVNENGSTEIKEVQQNVGNQIKSYLSSLFFNVCFAYSDDMIPKLIENVYNPALPSISPNNTSSQVTEIFSLLKNGKATSFTEEYDPESPSISPNNTINRPLTDLFSLLKNREPTSISEEYDPESRLISSNNIPHQLTDLLSLLKNREPTSISEEYDPQSLSISSQLNKDLFYPEQIVGNCTFASFSVGVRRRLKDDVFDKVLRGESSVFTSIGKMHNQGQIQLEIPPQAFRVQIEAKQNHFSSRLKDHLKNIYQNFLPKENFFYIMRPTIQDGNSYWYSNKKNGEDLGQWIDELFLRKQDEESTLRILIEGRAGLGKTIFSKQFSLEWHQNKPGVVIYLLLRNLSNEQRYPADKMYTVIDVIEKELYGKSFNDLERRLLVYELNRKETIWVVDGLDELHVLPQLKEAVKELMGKKKLIVTSRPGIEQHLQGQVDTDFQWCLFLQDYSEKEIHLFIDAYFSGSDSSLNSKEKIKQAIEKNKQLKELCSIPLTLNVICQLVKQGNEDVLVKENIAELYSCCIVAHLREAYKRQTNMDIHVPDSNIRGFYKTAVRFMELLAYESLQQYRNVFVSKEIVEGVLNLQGIDQHLDKQSLFEQLKAIGLVEVTPFGTEFIHATFQEYFAACFLIKSLKKSKKTKTYKDAQAFMEKHSYNFSYESLFSFMIQQLLFLISQEKEETTKKKLMGLLSNAVSNFAPPRLDNPRYVFLMGISMLNAYAKGIKSKAFTEE